jgi:hypothetical protein
MSYFSFILLSAPEYIVIMLLTFSFFRIKLSGFLPHLLFIAFILGNVSFATRADVSVTIWSPGVQFATYIVCVWLLFRIPIFYTSIICTVSYVSYAFAQMFIFFSLQASGLISFEEVDDSNLIGYIVPACSILITFIAVVIIKKFNYSIDWVPNNPRAKVELTKENKLFLSLVILIISSYFVLIYYRSDWHSMFFGAISIIMIVLLIFLIYISKKRDDSND